MDSCFENECVSIVFIGMRGRGNSPPLLERYMSTRRADLDILGKIKGTHPGADKLFRQVVRQASDSRLEDLRIRLVRAHRANDVDYVEKLEHEIIDYCREKY